MTLDEILAEIHEADAAVGHAKEFDAVAAEKEAEARTARETADSEAQVAAVAHASAAQLAAKAIADLEAYFGSPTLTVARGGVWPAGRR